jgi:hypothetical protein
MTAYINNDMDICFTAIAFTYKHVQDYVRVSGI